MYNRLMTTGYTFESAPDHVRRDHPESPARLSVLEPKLPTLPAVSLPFQPATRAEVSLVHTAALIQFIENACLRGAAIIDEAPTFVTRTSFEDALRAAGATLACLRAVAGGDVRNAFSIVRPPGHHAEPDRSMGFCIFNNIAIAARAALEQGLSRIAIVDYDAHHGNGTQAVFLDDERVAYLSTHQWGIYPGTGWYEEAPQARGRIVNVPLPAGAGDQAYDRIAFDIIEPFLSRFQPQMILVSAGFDAHSKDPLTSLGLSTAGFHVLSRTLVDFANELCNGRILFVLEGGYDPTNVANGALGVFAALAGRPLDAALDELPHEEPAVEATLAAVKAVHGF